jgi:hypothetical protein
MLSVARVPEVFMHPRFITVADRLHASYERLIASEPKPLQFRWPKEKVRAVYLFSEGDRHLYVGRTSNLRNRYDAHRLPSSKARHAAFAFRLAREETGRTVPAYRQGEGSVAGLEADPIFRAAFDAAKKRIREMDFRWVEEDDPVRQCLLEVYVAVALETPYNSFKTS